MKQATVTTFRAPDLKSRLDEIAGLRIAVFREWPYLYEGSLNYERDYLSTYLDNDRARIVTAEIDGRLVGASTCLPLADEVGEFRQPLADAGFDPARGFYFGESVLLPDFRGTGIGRRFMEERLRAAEEHGGLGYCCFCAVVRKEDDARRPAEYRPLDPFWRKMGFEPLPEVEAVFDWKEIGDNEESPHRMAFWMKRL